jgi:RND family efflux transporter MFP subunit
MELSKAAKVAGAVLALVALVAGLGMRDGADAPSGAQPEPRPALTVALTLPQRTELRQVIAADGNIAAWQEVVIGAETGGFRLTEVRVNVGDVVRKGQVLAQVSPEVAAADLAETRASVEEARAALAEASANADRARRVKDSGVMTAQLINQYLTAEKAAMARLEAVQARGTAGASRLARMRIVAPDDGVISARAATVGAMAQPGQELFRMVRDQRLEWRAEVTASELGRLRAGMRATVLPPGGGAPVAGTVRQLAPTVDPQTRNGIVYVDLPGDVMRTSALRSGMFARGEIEIGSAPAQTLPQAAVVQREGFSYVFRLEEGGRVAQQKVTVGRRVDDRVEIADGLDAQTPVVESGAGFLADGDTVKVVSGAVSDVR